MCDVIAHRGASAYAPEHTFAAYDLALEQGADVLELDVRVAADGSLLVVHDRTLLRTAGDPTPVAELSVGVREAMDPALRPPTLDAVLDRYGGATRWLVELKDPSPAWEHGVVEALRARGLERRAVVQSFDAASLRRLRRTAPRLSVSPLHERAPETAQLRATAAFASRIGVHHRAVDASLIARARACGLAVMGWTANEPAAIAALVRAGATGVITDVPDVARALVDRDAVVPAAA